VTETLSWLALARGTLDRATERRGDEEWLARVWAHPRTRVLVVERGRALVRVQDSPALVLLPPAEAPDGERYLLGVDADKGAVENADGSSGKGADEGAGKNADGRADEDVNEGADEGDEIAYFAVNGPLPAVSGAEAGTLRRVGALLNDRDSGLLVHAVALQNWHSTHPCCPRCGSRTAVTSAGASRTCPDDGSEHFPRVDPAVIMLVYDDADRILLARQSQWPERRVSILAGFVEPGESLEQAVIREVAEEVGLTVRDLRYLGSQPWPLPQSLMVGYFCRAVDARLLRVDEDEIVEAHWYTRDELRAAILAGDILLPGKVSIARHLIENWYGGELPGSWGL
jgi:NAD+ diphosphatase